MRSVRIVIPGRPVPHERVVPKKGGRPFTSRRTRDYEKLVASVCPPGVTLLGETCVTIQILVWSAQWGDVDNYQKSILDGLVKGGLLPDDKPIRRLVYDRDPCAKDQQRAIVCAYEFPRPVAISVTRS